jgi:amino acid adenylation domain-containing protein
MNAVAGQHVVRSVPPRRELSREKQALLNRRLGGGVHRRDRRAPVIARSGAREGPLSFGQQRFWFLEQLEPGQPVYHVAFGLRLTGPLNHAAIEASLNEIVRRHEALRTVFQSRSGNPVQIVTEPRPVQVPLIDLEELKQDKEAIHRCFAREAEKPFDLGSDLLLRGALFRIAPNQHVLLVTMHHIASDAWSIEIFVEEWCAVYEARVKGEKLCLPDLPVQYLDFAQWQRATVEADLKTELDYWKGQLGERPPILELVTDYPRPAFPANHGGTRSIVLGVELAAALSRLAREEGASKFMALLGAFSVLLYRYTGQREIFVGSPISRRTQQETERLIGLFLNTTVLRTDLSGDPTFRELLRRVRDTALDAYEHQSVPFEKIVEELQPARDTSRTPLFQVMFTLQDQAMAVRTLEGGLRVEPFEFDLDVSPFDLTLLMQENERGLEATVEFKTELFSTASIDRMLGHFQVLLEGIVSSPGARTSELPLVSESERRQLLVGFNSSQMPLPGGRCLHELFEEQAARDAERTAVKFGSRTLSYGELNERANELAHYLRSQGLSAEEMVGVLLERSPEMIVAILGILKAGGAYVPFEPDEPVERLAFKLRDAGVQILLSQRSLVPSLPLAGDGGSRLRIVCLDRDYESIARHSRGNLSIEVSPNHLAYLIYTSGSTGVPKGVLVEHRSLVNHSLGLGRFFELGPEDRVLQFAPLSFDVSAEEIFPSLLRGATLVLRPAGLAVSVQDFHPFVISEKLTVLNLPTPYWSEWMTTMEEGDLRLPSCLRLVVAGSDTVTREQYARWQRITTGPVRWCNAYGTTEATITSTIYEPAAGETPPRVPIGRPTPNTQIYVLDERQELAPIGVPGEIYIGGAEVARGYLNRSEAHAASFVSDRFSGQPGALLNRTGDFGRWRADGNLEFLGRRDNQVKIRGFRIEPGEIESALLQHPSIREAVVMAREDVHGEKRLVAYFVAAEGGEQLVGTLLEFLKQRLPAYMIPAAFVPIPKIPRLPSGKFDLQALPAPGAERPDLKEQFVAPSDSLEEKLANVWRQVLGLERVGVQDNFFNLGGHSLLAVRLFAEIEKLTGWNLPVLTLFQSPTVKELAAIIRSTQSSEKRSSIVTVQANGSRPPLYLVHGAGGGMLWGYANLSKHMGDDQPVYAFNSRGMDGLEELGTVEEMAAQYVKDLRAFQAQGPYYVGGYCFGGVVAFEVAQQLIAQGERVALLVLINAMPPNSNFEKVHVTPRWTTQFLRNSWHWFRYFAEWPLEQKRAFVLRKWRALRKRAGWARKANPEARVDAEDLVDVSKYSEDRRRLWNAHLRASALYRSRPYEGDVLVLRTRFHPFFCSFDPTYGWGELVRGKVTVRLAPGAHESILNEPNVRHAAEELKRCLEDAQAGTLEKSARPVLSEDGVHQGVGKE